MSKVFPSPFGYKIATLNNSFPGVEECNSWLVRQLVKPIKPKINKLNIIFIVVDWYYKKRSKIVAMKDGLEYFTGSI